MLQRILVLGFTAGLAALIVQAQQFSLRGPVMGLGFDPAARAVRPILGVPGAANVGDPLDAGFELTRAAIAPAGKFALVEAADSEALSMLVPGRASLLSIPSAPAGPEWIVFSPAGSSAVLYYRKTGRVLVLSGMPDEPVLKAEFEASLVPGDIVALAVNDDATLLLAGATTETDGAVYAVMPGGGVRSLLPLSQPAAIAFFEQRSDAVIAGKAPGEVYLVRDIGGAEKTLPLFDEAVDTGTPVAVAASSDGRRVFLASLEGVITITNLDDQTTSALVCACEPRTLDRLAGNTVFQLTNEPDGPIFVLDAGSPEPRIVFVPRAGGERL
jgi:hypothetical protein